VNDLGEWHGARTERIWPAAAEMVLIVVLIVLPSLAVLFGLLYVIESIRSGS